MGRQGASKRADSTKIGGIVEAIVALPSNPNVRRVRIGGRTVATLFATQLDELGIDVGSRWTAALAAAAAAMHEETQVRRAAMTMLGRAAMPSSRLRQRLEARGHAPAIVERVVERLIADGWLSDQAYAESAAAAVVRRGPAAARLVSDRLIRRGVNESLARHVADQATGRINDVDAAVRFARQRLQAMRGGNKASSTRRIAAALSRRGFDTEVVEEVLSRLGLIGSDEG